MSETNYIKLYVQSEGDRSVGIDGENTEILIDKRFIDGNYGDEKMCRDFIKSKMIDMFKELFDDGKITCIFDDECYNCRKLKSECKCNDE